MGIAVGIDLGTSNSVVTAVIDGKATVLADDAFGVRCSLPRCCLRWYAGAPFTLRELSPRNEVPFFFFFLFFYPRRTNTSAGKR